MVKLLLGLAAVPAPHDAADALAVAICHVHTLRPGVPDLGAARPWRLGARGARAATELARVTVGPATAR